MLTTGESGLVTVGTQCLRRLIFMTPKQRQMIYVVYITWRYYLGDWLVSGWRTSNILH